MTTMPAQKPGKSEQVVETPDDFIQAVLIRLGISGFSLDVAASPDNTQAPLFYEEETNGLIQPWYTSGWAWCNPPYCVDPDVQILKKDLTWITADKVQIGDELIAFTEESNNRFCSSSVVAKKSFKTYKVQVRTTEGEITVSRNHLFWAKKSYSDPYTWHRADELTKGMITPYFGKPWTTDHSWEAGYLAGLFDGEGHVAKKGAVGFGQNSGMVLDQSLSILRNRSFIPIEECVEVRGDKKMVHTIIQGGVYEKLRFLGSIRPYRLLPKAANVWEGRTCKSKLSKSAEIVSVTKLKQGEVVAIQTTSQTLITDGYFSHNCNISPWVEKAWTESQKGAHIVMLVPASTGSNWWRAHVDGKAYITFLNGRVTFVGHSSPYPKDLAVLLYAPFLSGGSTVWRWRENQSHD